MLVSPGRRQTATELQLAFAGDTGEGGDQAFAFLHPLLEQFEHALKSQVRRHGRKRHPIVHRKAVARRRGHPGDDNFVPASAWSVEADFRHVSGIRQVHRHIPVTGLRLDLDHRFLDARRSGDFEKELPHAAAEVAL